MSIRKSCFATLVAMLFIAQSALPVIAGAGQSWVCPIKGSCCKTMCPMKAHAPRAMPVFIRFAVVAELPQSVIDEYSIDYASATTPHPLRGFRFDREEPPRHFSLV
jgi:hypothetical protein